MDAVFYDGLLLGTALCVTFALMPFIGINAIEKSILI